MHVLVIKTSSMGDVLHTLPALTDAGNHFPDIKFDWIVEDAFAEIPNWHPLINKTISIKMRQWKKHPVDVAKSGKVKSFLSRLRSKQYDHIIDAQGLLKSAFFSFICKGKTHGLDFHSARESLASIFYDDKHTIDPGQHAIIRTRTLFANALGYTLPNTDPDANIQAQKFSVPDITLKQKYVVLLTNTTWATKHWPEAYWVDLTQHLASLGYHLYLPWNTRLEKQRVERISQHAENATVLPHCTLSQLGSIMLDAEAVIGVDTGLGHLAAALNIPSISLYGPTDPKQVGTVGKQQRHLCAAFECAPCRLKKCNYNKPACTAPACYSSLTPSRVKQSFQQLIKEAAYN